VTAALSPVIARIVIPSTTIATMAHNKNSESSREFIETAKYIFAVVVPVAAGWIVTVMAFVLAKRRRKQKLGRAQRST
jgi:hypothetical protein